MDDMQKKKWEQFERALVIFGVMFLAYVVFTMFDVGTKLIFCMFVLYSYWKERRDWKSIQEIKNFILYNSEIKKESQSALVFTVLTVSFLLYIFAVVLSSFISFAIFVYWIGLIIMLYNVAVLKKRIDMLETVKNKIFP